MRRFIRRDLAELHQNGVRIGVIGERERVDPELLALIDDAVDLTSDNSALNLLIAFNYGSRAEIARAARRLAERALDGKIKPEEITPDALAAALDTNGVPDPDLLIRTSGELRLSNFLLWQSPIPSSCSWRPIGRSSAASSSSRRSASSTGATAALAVSRRDRPSEAFERRGKRRYPMSEHDDAGDDAEPFDLSARLGSDFGPRVLSGLVMGAVAAVFTFSGAIAFSILVVAVALLLSWEWGRLVHGRDADVVVAIHVGSAGAAAALAAFGYVGLGLLALPIGAILAMVLSLGRNSAYSALGVFYAGLPAVTLIWLRSDATLGLLAVIFVIVIVIASDTFGFLFGRVLGGPRLWPRLSPNKTWSGMIVPWCQAPSGALFVCRACASALRLSARRGAVFAAQFVDLAESAIKRRFGRRTRPLSPVMAAS